RCAVPPVPGAPSARYACGKGNVLGIVKGVGRSTMSVSAVAGAASSTNVATESRRPRAAAPRGIGQAVAPLGRCLSPVCLGDLCAAKPAPLAVPWGLTLINFL